MPQTTEMATQTRLAPDPVVHGPPTETMDARLMAQQQVMSHQQQQKMQQQYIPGQHLIQQGLGHPQQMKQMQLQMRPHTAEEVYDEALQMMLMHPAPGSAITVRSQGVASQGFFPSRPQTPILAPSPQMTPRIVMQQHMQDGYGHVPQHSAHAQVRTRARLTLCVFTNKSCHLDIFWDSSCSNFL